MQSPVRIRRDIPFFYDKSEAEFRADIYERYEDAVVRQSILHLADDVWKGYPFQIILDWLNENLPAQSNMQIADIGCSVGRLIGEIAEGFPDSQCHGLDYSYQMLRQAQDFWVNGKNLDLDLTKRGFESIRVKGKTLPNLHFGLAKAEILPFEDASLDVIFNSFLLDRVDNPLQTLNEMHRVLKKGGLLFSISPFNFQKAEDWNACYPFSKLKVQMQNIGFQMNRREETFVVKEYLDVGRNAVEWKCTAFSAQKK
jgi:ubiquinone/menaquinone biosynthesis C-methylase UbiE